MKKGVKIALITLAVLLLLAVCIAAVLYFTVFLPEEQRREELELAIREYYENKLSLYEEENGSYADYEIDVAFLGDSLTDGYDLARYYPRYKTANRGIGGETTHGLENRLAVSVYDLKPKVAVMLIGGNNLDTMFENYEDILIGLRDNLPGTKVILVSLTAMGQGLADKNQLAAFNNVKIRKLAAKYGYSFVDVYTPLLNEQTDEIYSDYTTDGAHLTDTGYRVLTDAITPAIDSLLQGE